MCPVSSTGLPNWVSGFLLGRDTCTLKHDIIMCGYRGVQGVWTPPPPPKTQKIWFLSHSGHDLMKKSYQASIHCLAIISMPPKRHAI